MSSGERTLFFSVLVPCLLDFGMREVPAVNTGRARRKKEKDEAERGERSSKASKGTRQKKSGKGKQKEHNQCTRGCVCVSVYKNWYSLNRPQEKKKTMRTDCSSLRSSKVLTLVQIRQKWTKKKRRGWRHWSRAKSQALISRFSPFSFLFSGVFLCTTDLSDVGLQSLIVSTFLCAF